MPVENLEDEGLPKNPNLEIAQWKYSLMASHGENKDIANKLMNAIKTHNMAPFYEEICPEVGWTIDQTLLDNIKKENTRNLESLEKAIEDAETNLGETEVRDALLEKAEYLCKIGDKEGALLALRKTLEKTSTTGFKLDIMFYYLRIGLFYMDHDLITRNIEEAKSLIDKGGDWDRRNRLKVYQGIYYMSIRDFKKAADNFLESISTFTSYELMDYQVFVSYTVLTSMIALKRTDLREKVVNGSEILEMLHQLPLIKDFLMSFYHCHYDAFFSSLAKVEQELKKDRYFHPHYRYYIREMRILGYSQLLESYRSLTLEYMANAFGVSEAFIDKELSRFIAAGRLNCKIDKVNGVVETNRPDHKNWQYQSVVKQGDLLLNRIQKLSRIINV
ncbi:26S proteasome non-ATPase regulatory subunit 6-like [Xenia sp. Carnegie-2017]|uniref:26S proteasome non-ATPase regulatory subunit 6-like n=1 Tax=Xenia sp. Carnegie-2017 TaxID=2897299 RepID=UPI001F043C6D|nr:26S proteasome non-ATPase regulatory subunit 6-like [Xenia sp. Carnegie-2017]